MLATVAYFSEFEIVTKLVDSLVPRPLTAVMIAIAMPAAIRPYSMAVAPDSSFTQRETRFFLDDNSCVHTWLVELKFGPPTFSAP